MVKSILCTLGVKINLSFFECGKMLHMQTYHIFCFIHIHISFPKWRLTAPLIRSLFSLNVNFWHISWFLIGLCAGGVSSKNKCKKYVQFEWDRSFNNDSLNFLSKQPQSQNGNLFLKCCKRNRHYTIETILELIGSLSIDLNEWQIKCKHRNLRGTGNLNEAMTKH